MLAAKVKQKTALKERLISYGKLPAHVAIIMDGNGRWAKKRGLPRMAGHRAGVKTVKKIVRAAGDLGIKYLTLFTFSKENWRRPKSEVGSLMRLLYETTKREMEELNENNVRLITTGKVEELSAKQRQILEEARAVTAKNTGLTLNLALNYGGRDEILEAVKKIASDCEEGRLKSSEINEEIFSRYLFTKELPDPDLLVRTSGEMRLSNFLLWQTSYTELYITEVLWPDFTEEDFYSAIWDYLNRERRFGRVNSG